MLVEKEELEKKANKEILKGARKMIDEYTSDFLGTDAILELSQFIDRLMIKEILNEIPEDEKSECLLCGSAILGSKYKTVCDGCIYDSVNIDGALVG